MIPHSRKFRRASAAGLLLTLCASIFVGEALVMALLQRWAALPKWGVMLLDGALLLLALFPALYVLVFRPMRAHIAEHGAAERQLHEHDAELRATLDSTADGILAVDNHGQILHTNQRFTDLWGTPPEILVSGDGKAPLEFAMKQLADPEAFQARVQALYGSDAEAMDTISFKDGRTFERHSVPMRSDGVRIGRVWSFRDITERRLAEEAMRRSEWQVRRLLETVSLIGLILDRHGQVTFCNEFFLSLTGWAREDVMGRNWFDIFLPPDIRDEIRDKVFLESIEQGTVPAHFENEILTRSGERRLIRWSNSMMRDMTGSVDGVASIGEDVSAQRRAEDALKESEFFFRESQRAASIGSYRTDFTTGFWKSSEVLDTLFGIDAAYVRSVNGWVDLIHPDDHAMMTRYLEDDVLGKGHTFDKEYRIVRKSDGAVRWVHGIGALTFGADGTVSGMTGTIKDITERKLADDRLRESESRLRDITSSIGDWVWEVDERGVYTYSSAKGTEWFGAVIGKKAFDFMRRDEATRVATIFAGISSAKAPIRDMENWNVTRSGNDICLLTNGVPILDAAGNLKGYRGVDKDITDRKRAEQDKARLAAQLQQAQKMESVGRLAGGVAHDFNNMLGVILGNVDLALEMVKDAGPLHAELEEIRRATKRSVELTGQLLAFARKQTVAPKVLDLNETVTGTLRMLQRLIGEDIDLRWIPAGGLWLTKIDPSQLDQVLANLCVNARDAIAGTGRLTIETGNRTITEAECVDRGEFAPGEFVMLAVSDDGSGMDAETQSHLFEPFFTTKRMGQGTGLGLATVYGIVRQNGGFIDVDSKPLNGATFRIYLPRYVGKAEQAFAEERGSSAVRGHETILIAEDEPGILVLASRFLERQSYVVVRAGTPGEAIALAREHPGDIHLLITDVVMPEMNGRDLAKNLLSLYPHMKRLFMSGYTADIIANQGVLEDEVQFIQKPFTGDDLVSKVRAVLDRQ